MRKKANLKTAFSALIVCFALILPLFVMAASSAEDVTKILNQLQRADIDADVTTDMRTNQALVQKLLDAYNECPDSEKEKFTAEQNQALREYFTGLYKVQGKNTDEINSIMEGGSTKVNTNSSAAASVSQEAAASSSASSSSAVSSSSIEESTAEIAAISEPTAVSEPVSNSEVISETLPSSTETNVFSFQAVNPPHVPVGNEQYMFMGKSAFGYMLLFMLAALSLAVFLRYLAALRGVSKNKIFIRDLPEEEEQFTDSLLPREKHVVPSYAGGPSSLVDFHPADSAPLYPVSRTQESAPQTGPKKKIVHGRPGKIVKMQFRQGDPEDLSGIDD